MAEESALKTARRLAQEGKAAEGLAILRDALRRGQLAPAEVERAGRFIQSQLATRNLQIGDAPLRVLLLGQCTTAWLATSLTAVAWAHGALLHAAEGNYDNVLQDLSAAPGAEEEQPRVTPINANGAANPGPPIASRKPQLASADVVVLLPWTQGLRAGPAEALAFWQRAWELAATRLGARILQVGYDWVTPGPLGHHLGAREGDVALVRAANDALRARLPAGAFFVDLEQVAGVMGRERFYDPRRYHWTKQPFSDAGALLLAEHLWAGIRAMLSGPKKVLVLDLDNTLWGGIVGEAGPLGIAVAEGPDGEAYRAFQLHLKALAQRGVILAVASKNNPADAREPFRSNPDMALSLDDFAAFEASWEPKPAMLRRIAAALGLGLDSFVFFDDDPAEREQIRQALPEVEVVEVPPDPAEYVRALQAGLYFEAVALTSEDAARARQYRAEKQRRAAAAAFASTDDYLRSLQMRAEVGTIDEASLPRCAQLVAKTNQFNLTTRRHGVEEIRRLAATQGAVSLTVRVADRFGDHGLVVVLIAVPAEGEEAKTLRVDTWLMSCRVIGRTVEEFTFNTLLARARELGYERLVGEYIPTAKNAPVKGLYDRLGFRRIAEAPDGAVTYALDLAAASPAHTLVACDPVRA